MTHVTNSTLDKIESELSNDGHGIAVGQLLADLRFHHSDDPPNVQVNWRINRLIEVVQEVLQNESSAENVPTELAVSIKSFVRR